MSNQKKEGLFSRDARHVRWVDTYLEKESIVVVMRTRTIHAAGHALCPLHCIVLTAVLPPPCTGGTNCVSTPDSLSVAAMSCQLTGERWLRIGIWDAVVSAYHLISLKKKKKCVIVKQFQTVKSSLLLFIALLL